MAQDAAQQLALQKELASRVLARRRLIQFIKRRDDTYKDGWVHRDICMRLERFSEEVAQELSPRLMILMPPRHGKSRIASQEFPAWHLGRYPNHEFIAASYNVSLPMGFSRKIQGIIEDPRYPFETVGLDQNNKSAENWGLTKDGLIVPGGFVAAGVGGGITGKGAHILVIDDPIKNAEEADSLLIRDALWDWYTSTAYTRLAPGGGVLVIQTCWHDDDLAGRLQQVMKDNIGDPDVDHFEIIKYPAIADSDEWIEKDTDDIIRIHSEEKVTREDVEERIAETRAKAEDRGRKYFVAENLDPKGFSLVRSKGEPLHAERYNLKKLYRIMKTLPKRFWSALYQQNPVPDDGSFFTKDQFIRTSHPPKERCNVFLTADFAITEKQRNDWTVLRVGLQDEHDMLHMADMRRFKTKDGAFIVEAIITLIKRWKTPTMRLGFENGQIFMSIESMLRRRMREERLFVPYETLQPVTDKQARATPLQGRMQQGRVAFKDGADWFDVAQTEYLRFPNGVNDDIVDTDAWLARLVEKYEPPRPPKQQSQKSWKDQLAGMTRKKDGSHMSS